MAYSEKVLDHYENPRNVGVIDDDLSVGTGMVGAPACGDVMKLQIEVKPLLSPSVHREFHGVNFNSDHRLYKGELKTILFNFNVEHNNIFMKVL